MLFSVGTQVRFRHSGDRGVVTALLEGGMVSVWLPDEEMEIPAFVDDLLRDEASDSQSPGFRAKFLKGKKPKSKRAPVAPEIHNQYAILRGKGIQLAFDPELNAEGAAEKYILYLINDTAHEFIYDFQLYLGKELLEKGDGKMKAMSAIPIAEFLFDHLNEKPRFAIKCRRLTTEGESEVLQRELRIRPKKFFSKVVTAPLLNRQVHLFQLLNPAKTRKEKRKEDLKSYTQRNLRSGQHRPPSDLHPLSLEILEAANFIPEIDLHIDRLVDDPGSLNKADILRTQLRHFDRYLEKALRVGAERVFIIHGLGTGRLKK
ncbi:MAG: hypothetical protein R3350_09185, partial [Saprospiraceae bacterium]|nr:hypothetical protein [Saprospiraceae bacterium]